MKQFTEIEANPKILKGKPCLKNTRISVDMILEWMASGATIQDIVKAYPHLSTTGVSQALQYAAYYA
jgi:uncharacterized protein (DUF433 family)